MVAIATVYDPDPRSDDKIAVPDPPLPCRIQGYWTKPSLRAYHARRHTPAPGARRETRILLIGLGGAVGTIARYQLDGWVQRKLGAAFPYGTLAVNVLGSFLIAGIMYVGLRTEVLPPTVRIALTTGVIGGFTTYSTFNYETLRFLQGGAWGAGLLNLIVTVLGCLIAGLLGWTAGRMIVGS